MKCYEECAAPTPPISGSIDSPYTRKLMPTVTVATDIIVGFPGETDEQFQNTLDLLKEAQCDKVHVAMYSPRPGTLSARWEDDIPHEEKQRRHQAVEMQQEAICTARNATSP